MTRRRSGARSGSQGWISQHRLTAYVLLPAAVSLALMGLYFSGIGALQAIIVPKIPGLQPYSWREFGALEMLQNLVLLALIVLLIRSLRQARANALRAGLVVALAVTAFVLLEEIDYGLHFSEWLSGSTGSLAPQGWNRNLHNRVTEDGVQYGSYMKLAANLAVVAALFIFPLLPPGRLPAIARALQPSRWIIATVLLMVFMSWLAHTLDDAGLASVGGVPGPLEHNISEFRELNLYYLFLLYFTEITARAQSFARPGRGVDRSEGGNPRAPGSADAPTRRTS